MDPARLTQIREALDRARELPPGLRLVEECCLRDYWEMKAPKEFQMAWAEYRVHVG